MNDTNTEDLEQALAELQKKQAEIQEEIWKRQGFWGHPTTRMVVGGAEKGTKMVLSVEAMAAVEALARKIAAKYLVPEGHEGILDTPQGQVFIDMAMPTALHAAASAGAFGESTSPFVAATCDYAFQGNFFKHGHMLMGKAKSIMKEFAGEMGEIVAIGKQIMGVGQEGQGFAGMLGDTPDFSTLEAEAMKEAEKVRVDGKTGEAERS